MYAAFFNFKSFSFLNFYFSWLCLLPGFLWKQKEKRNFNTPAAVAEWVRRVAFNTKIVGPNPASVSVGGVQCHPPPQSGTSCGKIGGISLVKDKSAKAELWELGRGLIKNILIKIPYQWSKQ